MDLSPVIIAIPVYFTLMGAELVYEAITRKHTYRLNDAITNINLGALDQVTGTFARVVRIGIYTVVYELFAFQQIEANWISFAALFVLYDLCYYWSHRMAHEISLFWGGHVVHHQSEDFNLSVALRQSSTAFLWSFPFYLPLALLGFSPVQLVFVSGINLLYQFWIHTEHIEKLGPLEWVMNTPSHHRVHHGRDPKYIDRNYAGVFIIWDRLFGTFQKEEERPNYGITKPLNSWNPVYANVAHYVDLFRDVQRARSLGDAFRMLFHRPGWRPDYLGGPLKPSDVDTSYAKYNRAVGQRRAQLYILMQFLASLGPVAYFLFMESGLMVTSKVLFACWIIGSAVMFGFLFESTSRRLKWLELVRLAALPALFVAVAVGPVALAGWVPIAAGIFAALSAAAFLAVSRIRDRQVEQQVERERQRAHAPTK